MAVLLLWLLDASNNTAMEPYRAFLADKLNDSQLAKGFLTQSFFTGLGITLANVSLFVFEKILAGTTAAGIPYWVFGSFMLGAVCSIGSILVSVIKTPENKPSEKELAAIRAKPRGLTGGVREIASAVKDMPASLHKLGLVYLFQWFAITVYWQYVSLSIARTVWHTTPANESLYGQAVAWTGLANASYNVVTFCVAFYLVGLARRYGAKWVHVGALLCAAVGLIWFAHISNRYLLFVPMIGLGIAWASMMGVPDIMVVSMIRKERYGVYMGIVNMMIVVPMLIETVTFGLIYHFFPKSPVHALEFSGVLFAIAAVAMTWIRPPKKQSPVIPLTFHQIMGYDRILVGTDGSPSSQLAVERAGQVASAAEAELVVVTAYDPVPARDVARLELTTPAVREHQIWGKAHAEQTLEAARELVNSERVRSVRELAVEGDPVDAILATAAEQLADLIIVGNRGMGALAGHLLGSVPGEIAHKAPCDVLIVQTEQAVRQERLTALAVRGSVRPGCGAGPDGTSPSGGSGLVSPGYDRSSWQKEEPCAPRDPRQPGQARRAGADPAYPVPEHPPGLRRRYDLLRRTTQHHHEMGTRSRRGSPGRRPDHRPGPGVMDGERQPPPRAAGFAAVRQGPGGRTAR